MIKAGYLADMEATEMGVDTPGRACGDTGCARDDDGGETEGGISTEEKKTSLSAQFDEVSEELAKSRLNCSRLKTQFVTQVGRQQREAAHRQQRSQAVSQRQIAQTQIPTTNRPTYSLIMKDGIM